MCLHLVGLITIYVLPRFIRGERTQKTASTAAAASSNGPHPNVSSASDTQAAPVTQMNGAQSNGMNGHQKTKIVQSNAHNNELFVDHVPSKSNQCDINVNTINKLEMDADNANNGASNTVKSADAAASGNSLSNAHDYRQCATDDQHLSKKIRERIDSETRYIEEFIDKTVTGIVELKDDLMRVNQDDVYATNGVAGTSDDGLRKRNLSEKINGNEIETFLRKEMNNGNVIPAVLSNGHADWSKTRETKHHKRSEIQESRQTAFHTDDIYLNLVNI